MNLYQRAEAFRCRVYGGGETGRPSADDGYIAGMHVWTRANAKLFHKLRVRRVDEHRAVVVDGHGQARAIQGEFAQQLPTLLGVILEEPVRDAGTGQNVAKLMRAGRVRRAHNPEGGRFRLA